MQPGEHGGDQAAPLAGAAEMERDAGPGTASRPAVENSAAAAVGFPSAGLVPGQGEHLQLCGELAGQCPSGARCSAVRVQRVVREVAVEALILALGPERDRVDEQVAAHER